MATVLYPLGREKFLRGEISWNTDDIRCILIDAEDYTYNDAHEFVDDLLGTPAAEIARSGAFTGKTTTGGVADADDVDISGVTGDRFEAVVIFHHTGSDSTAPLIAYIDSGTGLPTTPNGGTLRIQWDNGSDKIFKL